MSSYAFRARQSGEILTPDQLRTRHRAQASFGATITPDVADALGYDVLTILDKPAHNPATQVLAAIAPQIIDGKWMQQWAVSAIPAAEIAARLAETAGKAAREIDEAVAEIYGRFTRFALEYTEREQQAQAFKDAGYTGDVPPRVAEFATPAGMPAQAATDLILAQSVNLRAAQGQLSALRMRKYEVLRAPDIATARTRADAILAAIAAVGAQVS